jgi:hypothetical protein
MSYEAEPISILKCKRDAIERPYNRALLAPRSFLANQSTGTGEQGLPQAAVTSPVYGVIDRNILCEDRHQATNCL